MEAPIGDACHAHAPADVPLIHVLEEYVASRMKASA